MLPVTPRPTTPPTCSPPPSTSGKVRRSATAPTSSGSARRPAAWKSAAARREKPTPPRSLTPGAVDEAVAAAEALVTDEPLREGGWAVLIEALAGAQRYAEALRAFQRAAAVLAEVGLEPSNRLREAEQIALSGDATRRRLSDGEPHTPAAPRRFHPPIVPSSFIGRDDDTDLVVDLLENARLVTLTGPGGVGKTRLALEVARRAEERFELGACVVELAPVEDPTAVPDVVVASLGLTTDGRSAVELLPKVGALDVLIVLDNAEHVIEHVAATVERILAGGPAGAHPRHEPRTSLPSTASTFGPSRRSPATARSRPHRSCSVNGHRLSVRRQTTPW